jgi:protein ImuB
VRALVVWCPDWPATATGHGPADLAAVLESGLVVAATEAARAAGVQVGLRRREAEARCPGLVTLGRDQAAEARSFERVVAAVATLTPRVEVTRPGLLTLNARGPARYFGGEAALARRVAATAAPAVPAGSLAPMVGVADGRFAAELAAHLGLVVPAGGNARFLAPWPVGVFGDPELAGLLNRLGLPTLGDFAALPASAVLARFGSAAYRAHGLARGVDEAGLVATAPDEPLTAAMEFDPPAEQAETAAFAARSLAEGLVEGLERQGLVCVQVRIDADTEHAESLSRRWRGDEGLGADAMTERLRWQLDGWLSGTTAEPAPTAGITLLRLVAEEVASAGGRQPELWGGPSDADVRARRGLDRLRGMLGPDAVYIAALTGGRGPAERVILIPWGDPDPPRPRPRPGQPPVPSPPARPGRLDRPDPPRPRPRPGQPPVPSSPDDPDPSSSRSARAPAPGSGSAPEFWVDLSPSEGIKSTQKSSGRKSGPLAQPWPGRHPAPAPALVHPTPLAAEVVGADGAAMTVSARGRPSAAPARLVVEGGSSQEVVDWAGPWTSDERWWDQAARRRRARLQLVCADGSAHLVMLEAGHWWIEATYG